MLGLNYEGRKNGFGAMLFESQDEAARAAKEMNQKYIGNRYVDLSIISYDEYRNFNDKARGGDGGNKHSYGGN